MEGKNSRTPVIVARGDKHKGKIGSIAGKLGEQNKHVTKVVVIFYGGGYGTVEIANLDEYTQGWLLK